MASKSLAEALDEALGFVERAVAKIERREDAETELHNVRAYILNILDLVERTPGISASADDLYAAVVAVASAAREGEVTADPRRGRLLREARERFRDRISRARPSEQAKHLGLT
jgi:Asp-tRNA(Asn)/Glu-tRNA(Gln) amidotransferase C subunit